MRRCRQTDRRRLEEKGSSFGDPKVKQGRGTSRLSVGRGRQLRRESWKKGFILSGKPNGRVFSHRTIGRQRLKVRGFPEEERRGGESQPERFKEQRKSETRPETNAGPSR